MGRFIPIAGGENRYKDAIERTRHAFTLQWNPDAHFQPAVAFRFADYLHAAGQRIWQVLPLNPTEEAFGNSPYHSVSCFAYNPLLISPESLPSESLLDSADLQPPGHQPQGRVDYPAAVTFKRLLLEKACFRFRQCLPDTGYESFCTENTFWIDDYALFRALSMRHANADWNQWPQTIRNRKSGGITHLGQALHEVVEKLKIEQYFSYRQWLKLRSYCREKHIHLFGDIPIYVPLHSADVWAHRQLFKLDRTHRPLGVSGVPRDYFSADGQLWGHPVYNWKALRQTRYDWWIRRIAHQMAGFDAVRIDHFRGLVAYWEVPAGENTAWFTLEPMTATRQGGGSKKKHPAVKNIAYLSFQGERSWPGICSG